MGEISKPYKIDDRNRIVIPDLIMKKFKLQPGDRVVYELLDDTTIKLGFKYLSRETIRKISQAKR